MDWKRSVSRYSPADRPELRAQADMIIKEVVAVQEPSGYLNTYYVEDRAKDRMAPEIQRVGPRTLQSRPHDPGRDCVLSRHG